jgi:H+/Cl- antiporter ClcA
MIGFFTNLFYYYQRLSVQLVSPDSNTLGAVAIVIPIVGGLIVGLMARFGSEQIRGHGIPEAMERILINGSKVAPRLAVLSRFECHQHRHRRSIRGGGADHLDRRRPREPLWSGR